MLHSPALLHLIISSYACMLLLNTVQSVMHCANEYKVGACSTGGQWEKVYNFVQNVGVVDESCMPYLGIDRGVNALGSCLKTICRECTSDGSCNVIPNPRMYKISSWGKLANAQEMQIELYKRGPIPCYIYTHLPKFANYKGGIIMDNEQYAPGNITHVVSIIGYGVDPASNVPYWTFRNWAGATWGEDGFGRIARGNNTLNIEWNCGWAEPEL